MKVNFNRIIIPNDKEFIRSIFTNLLRCKICLNILNNPYDCVNCNQTFCKSCICGYIQVNGKCPYDSFFKNETKDKTQCCQHDTMKQSSTNIRNIINSLKFYCVNRDNGCKAEMSIEGLNEHEKKCIYNKPKIIFNKKQIIDKTKISNNKNQGCEVPIENDTDKFKFQDSCMSFRNVDTTGFDTNNINTNSKRNGNSLLNRQNIPQYNTIPFPDNESDIILTDVNTNNNNNTLNYTNSLLDNVNKKINDISTFIYSILNEKNCNACSLKGTSQNKNTVNNKKGNGNNIIGTKLTKKNNGMPFTPRKKEPEDPESTPKFRVFSNKEINDNNNKELFLSTCATCSHFKTLFTNRNNFNQDKDEIKPNVLSEIKKLSNKITSIERLIQSNSALEPQKYFIQTYRNSTNINSPTTSFSTQSSQFDIKLNSSKKSLLTIPKTNATSSLSLKKKFSESMKKQIINSSRTSKETNHIITKEYIDNLFISKIEEIKKYIEEKCIDELKTYFLEISMDNVNLFIEKINELSPTVTDKIAS